MRAARDPSVLEAQLVQLVVVVSFGRGSAVASEGTISSSSLLGRERDRYPIKVERDQVDDDG